MMRLVVLFGLAGGAISALAQGSLGVSELSLLGSLLGQLASGDILLGIAALDVILWSPCSNTSWGSISSVGPLGASMAADASSFWPKMIG